MMPPIDLVLHLNLIIINVMIEDGHWAGLMPPAALCARVCNRGAGFMNHGQFKTREIHF